MIQAACKRDTVFFHRALESYRAETGNNRPVSEFPFSVLSRLLQSAQVLKSEALLSHLEPEPELERARR